jgi:NAD(P)-dependent dehydrogenase (short-subunit alcohol dehydrogenase family)
MRKMVVFGGSGGLGKQLIPLLKQKYDVISLSSKDVDITNFNKIKDFFNVTDVDIVLNMSGKIYDVYLSKISEYDCIYIENMINVNIIGNINILSTCLPKMIDKKWGRVISISSILSDMNIPKASLYSASKAFINRLYSSANKENIEYGITCNTIQLGYWDGGMCNKLNSNFKKSIKNSIGLKRFGKIEELYNTINYIIDNEYVCGTNLKIDGGL